MLGDRQDTVVEDAILVADELVTNALQHAAAPRRCRISLTGEQLRIEVDDAAPDRDPLPKAPDRTGGRGLVLVDQLTSAWGVEHHPDGKTVWAEVALDQPGGP